MTKAAAKRLHNYHSAPSDGGTVLYTFENVNLSKSFKGLGELAMEIGIDPEEMAPGQYLLFFNAKKTMCAVYGAGNVVTKHKKFSVAEFTSIENAISPITRAFLNEGEVDFDEKVNRALFGLLEEEAALRRGPGRPRREAEAAQPSA